MTLKSFLRKAKNETIISTHKGKFERLCYADYSNISFLFIRVYCRIKQLKMTYEIIGKIFISILIIILSWAAFWYITLAHHYFFEELPFAINVLGVIVGIIITINYIWL